MDQFGSPAISVVIPLRNMAAFVEETLQSLVAQTTRDFETIVVDDGSTDATMGIVCNVGKDLPILHTLGGPQRGVSAARNAGLAAAAGRNVVFLDGDDLLAPCALERFQSELDTSDAPAVLGGIVRISADGAALPSPDNRTLAPKRGQLRALLKKNFVVNGGALAIRTAAARAAGGYDTTLKYGEDWEFWCRLALQGEFALLGGGPVLSYRQVASGANVRAQGNAFALGMPCILALRRNPEMRKRFGPRLAWLLRQRQIDIFWSGVRGQFQFGHRLRGGLMSFAGLLFYPDSILRPQLAVRFVKSLRR